jgi:hypothetical protein
MPIIKPTKTFEGSNLERQSDFSYIKNDVRQIIFNKKTNTEGLYLLFMPAYKQGITGNPWFKVAKIGDKIKKRYYVKNENADPATYFERNFRALYPELAKPQPAEGSNKYPIYPNYGRLATRVIFNVGVLKELLSGEPVDKVLHVLDLPSYNGADLLTKWMKAPQPDGTPNPMINDPEACIPVFVKLNSGGGTSPWEITPNSSKRYKIPDVYADSDNLYNLDEIFVDKSTEEIVDELRGMFNGSIFDQCMEGYQGLIKHTITVLPITPTPVTSTLPLPASPDITVLPSPSKHNNIDLPVAPGLVSSQLPANPVVTEISGYSGPVASTHDMTEADLKSFLKRKAKAS